MVIGISYYFMLELVVLYVPRLLTIKINVTLKGSSGTKGHIHLNKQVDWMFLLFHTHAVSQEELEDVHQSRLPSAHNVKRTTNSP